MNGVQPDPLASRTAGEKKRPLGHLCGLANFRQERRSTSATYLGAACARSHWASVLINR